MLLRESISFHFPILDELKRKNGFRSYHDWSTLDLIPRPPNFKILMSLVLDESITCTILIRVRGIFYKQTIHIRRERESTRARCTNPTECCSFTLTTDVDVSLLEPSWYSKSWAWFCCADQSSLVSTPCKRIISRKNIMLATSHLRFGHKNFSHRNLDVLRIAHRVAFHEETSSRYESHI